jgi:fructose-bisphosphate aldolase, class I
MNGKQIRLSRLMDSADGRSYIVAADHAFLMGPSDGTYNLEATLKEVLLGSPDGILLSKGRAGLLSHLFQGEDAPSLIIRADWFSGPRLFSHHLPLGQMDKFMACTAEEALALGAEAMMVYFLASFTPEFDMRGYTQAAAAVRECEALGLPLIAEPLPGNPFVDDEEKNRVIIEASHQLEALGASALKVPYINEEGLSRLVEAVKIPVWVLGGDKEEEAVIYSRVESHISLGARGIVFGRNVIQAERPGEVSQNLCKIVHPARAT